MNTHEYAAGTHVGRVREHNEDYYYVDPVAGLWLIADGMGGHQSGEIASATVGEYIPRAIEQGISVEEAIIRSHSAIFDAVEKGQGSYGMGTTVVVLKMDGNAYEIAWVGDSRAYLWNGELRPLTRDHSLVQRLLDAGAINAQEAKDHPQRNRLTNVLGASEPILPQVDSIQGILEPGEYILLCSDGLSGEVNEEKIADILNKPLSIQDKVNGLIEAALDTGGRDNITVLLISSELTHSETATMKLRTLNEVSASDASSPRSQLWVWLATVAILVTFVAWLWISQKS